MKVPHIKFVLHPVYRIASKIIMLYYARAHGPSLVLKSGGTNFIVQVVLLTEVSHLHTTGTIERRR